MSAVSTGSTPEMAIGSTSGAPLPTEDFCGHCGEEYDGGEGPPSYAHQRFRERLAMEPPRYCAASRRRIKVQVTPLGWTAACSRHGVLAS